MSWAQAISLASYLLIHLTTIGKVGFCLPEAMNGLWFMNNMWQLKKSKDHNTFFLWCLAVFPQGQCKMVQLAWRWWLWWLEKRGCWVKAIDWGRCWTLKESDNQLIVNQGFGLDSNTWIWNLNIHFATANSETKSTKLTKPSAYSSSSLSSSTCCHHHNSTHCIHLLQILTG